MANIGRTCHWDKACELQSVEILGNPPALRQLGGGSLDSKTTLSIGRARIGMSQ